MHLISLLCYGYLSQLGNYIYNGGASVANFAIDLASIPYNIGAITWKGAAVGMDKPLRESTQREIDRLIKIGKISAIVTGVSLTAGFAANRYKKYRENRLLNRISNGLLKNQNMDISYKIIDPKDGRNTKARPPDQKANLITLGHTSLIPPIGNVKV